MNAYGQYDSFSSPFLTVEGLENLGKAVERFGRKKKV
jgi:hypothetical protein